MISALKEDLVLNVFLSCIYCQWEMVEYLSVNPTTLKVCVWGGSQRDAPLFSPLIFLFFFCVPSPFRPFPFPPLKLLPFNEIRFLHPYSLSVLRNRISILQPCFNFCPPIMIFLYCTFSSQPRPESWSILYITWLVRARDDKTFFLNSIVLKLCLFYEKRWFWFRGKTKGPFSCANWLSGYTHRHHVLQGQRSGRVGATFLPSVLATAGSGLATSRRRLSVCGADASLARGGAWPLGYGDFGHCVLLSSIRNRRHRQSFRFA